MPDPRDPVPKSDRRDFLIGGTCLGGALLGGAVSAWGEPTTLPVGGLAALIPEHIGGWRLAGTGDVIVAEDGETARTPYDDLLTRIYRSGSAPPVTMLVAYGATQRGDVRIHRPESCYPAAGFTLSDHEIVLLPFSGLPAVPARIVHAASVLRAEHVLYWIRIGARFPTDGVEQRWAVIRDHLAGRMPDGVLVRLSSPISERPRAREVFHAFVAALLASAPPDARAILFGKPG